MNLLLRTYQIFLKQSRIFAVEICHDEAELIVVLP